MELGNKPADAHPEVWKERDRVHRSTGLRRHSELLRSLRREGEQRRLLSLSLPTVSVLVTGGSVMTAGGLHWRSRSRHVQAVSECG